MEKKEERNKCKKCGEFYPSDWKPRTHAQYCKEEKKEESLDFKREALKEEKPSSLSEKITKEGYEDWELIPVDDVKVAVQRLKDKMKEIVNSSVTFKECCEGFKKLRFEGMDEIFGDKLT